MKRTIWVGMMVVLTIICVSGCGKKVNKNSIATEETSEQESVTEELEKSTEMSEETPIEPSTEFLDDFSEESFEGPYEEPFEVDYNYMTEGYEDYEEFEYGCATKEEALTSFWECVKNEDVELAKKISFTYYIRFQKSGREMFVTPTWNEYLSVVGYTRPDSPAVQTEEVINGFKDICENPDEWLEDYKVEDAETLASYERRIYDLFGLNCVIQASLRYDYSYKAVNVIEIDNRWFVVNGYSSWWDHYTYD